MISPNKAAAETLQEDKVIECNEVSSYDEDIPVIIVTWDFHNVYLHFNYNIASFNTHSKDIN